MKSSSALSTGSASYDQIKKVISGHKAPGHKASSPTAKKSKTTPAPDALAELIRCFDSASEEVQTAFLTHLLDEIGPDGLRAAMSPALCDALRKRYEAQLARTNPRIATVLKIVPTAKVLAPPAPASSSALHHDLVSTWDAAAAEERNKLRHEREAELYAAI
jgi:hypothetical protein